MYTVYSKQPSQECRNDILFGHFLAIDTESRSDDTFSEGSQPHDGGVAQITLSTPTDDDDGTIKMYM